MGKKLLFFSIGNTSIFFLFLSVGKTARKASSPSSVCLVLLYIFFFAYVYILWPGCSKVHPPDINPYRTHIFLILADFLECFFFFCGGGGINRVVVPI